MFECVLGAKAQEWVLMNDRFAGSDKGPSGGIVLYQDGERVTFIKFGADLNREVTLMLGVVRSRDRGEDGPSLSRGAPNAARSWSTILHELGGAFQRTRCKGAVTCMDNEDKQRRVRADTRVRLAWGMARTRS